MRYASKKTAILIAGGILSLCLYFTGCDDNPVEPDEPKDYPAYFFDAYYNDANWYFAYHPASNQVDSFWLPYSLPPLISADGKKMYITGIPTDHIDVLDTDSMVVIDQLPYVGAFAVSPDNRLIAVVDDGLSLSILETSDYSVVFHDTTTFNERCVFSSNSQRFYGAPQAGGVYILDLSDSQFPITIITPPFGSVRDLAPSHDESKVFLYLQRPQLFWYGAFAVYDLAADSLIFSDTLRPGFGELEPTPDGRYVFYTNPGHMLYGPGLPWIRVYDVQRNAIHKEITTAGVLEEPYGSGVPLEEICVTPDGQWVVALAVNSYDFVIAFDVYNMAVSKYVRLGHSWLWGVSCQKAP